MNKQKVKNVILVLILGILEIGLIIYLIYTSSPYLEIIVRIMMITNFILAFCVFFVRTYLEWKRLSKLEGEI